MSSSITYVSSIIIALSICLMHSEPSFAQQSVIPNSVIKINPGCTPGPHKQSNGPFAIMAFCEDALGNYVMLYYADSMGSPLSADYPKWLLDNRVWQDKVWGSDVTSFAWGTDGKHVYIATSMIYGDGGIFDIDLVHRSAERIFPKGKFETGFAYVTEILEVDSKKESLKVLVTKYPNNGGSSLTETFQLSVKH